VGVFSSRTGHYGWAPGCSLTVSTQLSRVDLLITEAGTIGILTPNALNAVRMRAAWIASTFAIPAVSAMSEWDLRSMVSPTYPTAASVSSASASFARSTGSTLRGDSEQPRGASARWAAHADVVDRRAARWTGGRGRVPSLAERDLPGRVCLARDGRVVRRNVARIPVVDDRDVLLGEAIREDAP
jgi:hypothetical protein